MSTSYGIWRFDGSTWDHEHSTSGFIGNALFVGTGVVVAAGEAVAPANQAADLEPMDLDDAPRMLLIEWTGAAGGGRNHYLAGNPPVDLDKYRAWLRRSGLYPETT